MIEFSNEAIIKKKVDLVFDEENQVAMEVFSGEYFQVNDVTISILVLLDQPSTLDQLCDKVCEEYEVEKNDCLPDLRSILGDLQSLNIISIE